VTSLYDELAEKLAKDPSLTKRGGPRADIGLLLVNAADDLRELWLAADAELADGGSGTRGDPARLAAAVEALRPIYGDRPQ